MTVESETFHSGSVAIVGRPNVGKSTLLNALLGTHLSIVSDKPQTTRNRIMGVLTRSGRGQIVFIDTPGVHASRRRLNARMVEAALRSLDEADVVLFLVDAPSLRDAPHPLMQPQDHALLEQLRATGLPLVLGINKMDRTRGPAHMMPILARVNELPGLAAVVPMSALQKRNVEPLIDTLIQALPVGPMLYDEDTLTDRSERFLAAEMVREQVMNQTEQEVPYGVAIEVEEFREDLEGKDLHISMMIHVERDSQKGILIGKSGARIKALGVAARKQLEAFFARPVHLKLAVRVEEGWSEKDRALSRFGYDEDQI